MGWLRSALCCTLYSPLFCPLPSALYPLSSPLARCGQALAAAGCVPSIPGHDRHPRHGGARTICILEARLVPRLQLEVRMMAADAPRNMQPPKETPPRYRRDNADSSKPHSVVVSIPRGRPGLDWLLCLARARACAACAALPGACLSWLSLTPPHATAYKSAKQWRHCLWCHIP